MVEIVVGAMPPMTTAKFCIVQRIDCDRVEGAITSIASIVKENRLTFTFTQEFGSRRRGDNKGEKILNQMNPTF